jgi:hypothetical protein
VVSMGHQGVTGVEKGILKHALRQPCYRQTAITLAAGLRDTGCPASWPDTEVIRRAAPAFERFHHEGRG